MTVSGKNRFDELPEDVMIRVNWACNQFEQRWQAGQRPKAEEMLGKLDATYRDALFRTHLMP